MLSTCTDPLTQKSQHNALHNVPWAPILW